MKKDPSIAPNISSNKSGLSILLGNANLILADLEEQLLLFQDLSPKAIKLLSFAIEVNNDAPLDAKSFKTGILLSKEISISLQTIAGSQIILFAKRILDAIELVTRVSSENDNKSNQEVLEALLDANHRIHEMITAIDAFSASVFGIISTISDLVESRTLVLRPALDENATPYRTGLRMALAIMSKKSRSPDITPLETNTVISFKTHTSAPV